MEEEVLTRRGIFLGGLKPELGLKCLRLSLRSGEIEAHCRVKLVVEVDFMDLKNWLNLHALFPISLSVEPPARESMISPTPLSRDYH